MELWGIEIDWAVFGEPGVYRNWMLICIALGVLALTWIAVLLTRGGFGDLDEIIRSPYATPAERLGARAQGLPRSLLLILAALIGALSVSVPIFFQGVLVIFLWNQIFG
ncbi:hypothetical protein F1654_13325 [Alkalicaulis satelles]|uniref:Uncharacterized protein n=1 Tax=Alkalicaulis satelles TaxID=2609175 RepID=A0A5M6ZAW0_9PROT|nr:hypothetical protein [Alkalicaulis satelles]KAA5801034.1 hypothetical protein F1654_13325 [Alkalicaulis satelles]